MHLLLSLVLVLSFLTPAVAADSGTTEPPKLGVIIDSGAFDPSKGLPIKGVVPGSTAAALGLRAGDLLASINGKAIGSEADVLAALSLLAPGAPISVIVGRGGVDQTLAGTMLSPPTAENLLRELAQARGEMGQLKGMVEARTREPTLAELLHELQQLQEQFPRAAAEFKKLYPNGEFSIVIRITSDKTAAEPVDLLNLKDAVPAPGVVPPPAPAAP